MRHFFTYLLPLFFLFLGSCRNELDVILEESYDCYGNIVNVQYDLMSLNDCDLQDGGEYASTFRVIAEFRHGECLDSNTVIIDRVSWYDESDAEVQGSQDVNYSYGAFAPVGNKVITNICIRFGSHASYAEVRMITANMLHATDPKTGETLAAKVRINRPKSAN